MKPQRIEILGVPVDGVDMASALGRVEAMARGDRCRTVIAVNPEKVMKACEDADLLAALRAADLLIPDGIGVVLAARLLGLGRMRRVPGSELMPAICGLAVRSGLSVFLYGARPEVNARAGEVLRERYPGLRIAGLEHGYVPEDGMADLIARIDASGADILFVGLGSPRQELWMARHAAALGVKVCQGVGGTFDVLAGRVKRAPALFLRLNLEWFYRLVSEPSRLARQSALPRFAAAVLRERLRG